MIGGARVDAVKCKAFLLAVECGSLTEVAERMGYTQPGITRRFTRSRRTRVQAARAEQARRGGQRQRARDDSRPPGDGPRSARGRRAGVQHIRDAFGCATIGCYWSVGSSGCLRSGSLLRSLPRRQRIVARGWRSRARAHASRNVRSTSASARSLARRGVRLDSPCVRTNFSPGLPAGHPKAGLAAFPVADVESESFIVTLPGIGYGHRPASSTTNHVTPKHPLTNRQRLHGLLHGGGGSRDEPQQPPALRALEWGRGRGSLRSASVHLAGHRRAVAQGCQPCCAKVHRAGARDGESMGHVSLP